ncbi:hypothetical protein ACFL0G_04765 [Candidatus Zixiibacteriota bacterium]
MKPSDIIRIGFHLLNKLLSPVIRSLCLLCFLCHCFLLVLVLIDPLRSSRYVLLCVILMPFPLVLSMLTKWLNRLITLNTAESDLLRFLRLLVKYALPGVYLTADLAVILLLLVTRKQIYANSLIYLAGATLLVFLLNLLFRLRFPVAGIDYR